MRIERLWERASITRETLAEGNTSPPGVDKPWSHSEARILNAWWSEASSMSQ